MSGNVPQLSWHHIDYDVVDQTHVHIQEAGQYPGLWFVWTLNVVTNERTWTFHVGENEYDELNDAIANWQPPKRRRVRL